MEARTVAEVLKAKPTIEGAGVKLMRGFGSPQLAALFDPFLLLDDFGSSSPHEYLAGFPWHPHRGIETVTYLLRGEVSHEDSTGTKGTIRSGDLQWMSSGSGIYHSEMPRPPPKDKPDEIPDTEMRGFQLWVNIPAAHKMDEPNYKNLLRQNIPEAELDDGTIVKVVAGQIKDIPRLGDLTGPVKTPFVDAHYLDISMPEQSEISYKVKDGYTAFAYVMEGQGMFDRYNGVRADKRSVVLYRREGDTVKVSSEDIPVRFLLISGKPIKEPVAWYGPIVMNNRDQLATAFQELQTDQFIKHRATSYDYFQ